MFDDILGKKQEKRIPTPTCNKKNTIEVMKNIVGDCKFIKKLLLQEDDNTIRNKLDKIIDDKQHFIDSFLDPYIEATEEALNELKN